MMNAAQHRAEAERFAVEANQLLTQIVLAEPGSKRRQYAEADHGRVLDRTIQLAQVHATLAGVPEDRGW